MSKREKPATWSISAGERGHSRVRAFEKTPGGDLFLEWHEPDSLGKPQRKRAKLPHRDRKRAEKEARDVSRELGALRVRAGSGVDPEQPLDLSIRTLIAEYIKEVTPAKGRSKQGHDRRAERVFLAFFDAQEEPGRRSSRHPSTLDRVDWDRFIAWRGDGRIPGWEKPAKNRMIQYDLKYLVAVLTWALAVKDQKGRPYLTQNPWGEQVRRTQKWDMPKEKNPRRVPMTMDLHQKLLDHSPHWQFRLALVMERHTGRRNNQIRQLLWSDLDLEGGWIFWRGEIDKAGLENRSPLPRAVRDELGRVPRGIGKTPVFPSDTDPTQPTGRDTFQVWLRRAKTRAGIEVAGLGFHSEKRAAVRDPRFRALPPLVQEQLAGTSYATLRKVYDEVSPEDLKDAQRELDKRWA